MAIDFMTFSLVFAVSGSADTPSSTLTVNFIILLRSLKNTNED